MQYSKINTLEAIVLVLSIVIAHTILSLPRELVVQSKSATILNILFVGLVVFTIVFLIYKLLHHFPGQDILDISHFLGGGIFQKILGLLFIAYFMVSASMMLRSFCEALKIVYYPMTNISFLLLFFIMAIGIANRLDFHATLKTTLMIVPIVLVSIIFMFVVTFKGFTPEKIFPILGDGFMNTFVLGLTNLYAFGGIVYLYFLPPLLKKPEKFKKVCFLSMASTLFYILLSVTIILFVFPFFIQTNEIMPLYSVARYIDLRIFLSTIRICILIALDNGFCLLFNHCF
ncbi:MAG: GerAB/ArcD/ProY family transporter [Clostridia bacterium]